MATPSLTYDPSQIVVVFNGANLHGFAEGTFVKITRDEDAFTKHVGSDGEVARVRNKNRGGSVAITLMQTSTGNDVLAAAAALDETGSGGTGSVLVKDLNGATLATASVAWVKKMPDTTFGKDIESREWVLDCAYLNLFTGGNPN